LQLQGGVGNQLFIWTMAHELSKTYRCHVQLVYLKDHLQRADRLCEVDKLQNFCVHDISIVESRIWSFILRAVDKINTITFFNKINVSSIFGVVTLEKTYETPSLKNKPPRFLRGYFQSNSLVEKNSSVIRSEIKAFFDHLPTFDSTPSSYNVSHIRRGDTVHQAVPVGILSLDYYKKYAKYDKPLFVCTDDDEIVTTLKLEFPNSIVIPPEACDTWQILKLMSYASHLIMANSTLSWWAGWFLSKTPGATVVFPSPWRPYDPLITENLMLENVLVATSMFEER